jgi:hypothetical protein
MKKRPLKAMTGSQPPGRILTAYRIHDVPRMELVPAASARAWMDATGERFANRCLPLLMANQSGWFLLSSHRISVVWDGGNEIKSLEVQVEAGDPPAPAVSHFGAGILTWNIPFLFRTSPGYNLLVRGPANMPKDGVHPLEGLVETDWSAATFTMNWKVTRPNEPVVFEIGEPICMLVPQRRGELEEFQPRQRGLASDPEVFALYRLWEESRRNFLIELKVPGSEAAERRWQKDYFQGIGPKGSGASEHQTKLSLRPFLSED